jgi:type VI protein secretion system component VasK
LQSFSGPWAPFQLFNNASRSAMNGNLYTAEWAAASGAPIKIGLEVDFGNGAPVLRKGYFAGLRCVGRVAQ